MIAKLNDIKIDTDDSYMCTTIIKVECPSTITNIEIKIIEYFDTGEEFGVECILNIDRQIGSFAPKEMKLKFPDIRRYMGFHQYIKKIMYTACKVLEIYGIDTSEVKITNEDISHALEEMKNTEFPAVKYAKSLYELACKNGFSGSPSDFFKYLTVDSISDKGENKNE